MTEARAGSFPPGSGSGAPGPGIVWDTEASDPGDRTLMFTRGGVGGQGHGCSHAPLWLPAEPLLTVCSWHRGPGLNDRPKEATLGVTAGAPSHIWRRAQSVFVSQIPTPLLSSLMSMTPQNKVKRTVFFSSDRFWECNKLPGSTCT